MSRGWPGRTARASRPRLTAPAASAGSQPIARAVGTSSAGTRPTTSESTAQTPTAVIVGQAGRAEIATLVKRHGDAYYVFAVNMEKKPAKVRLRLAGIVGSTAAVLGEDRVIAIMGGAIEDAFEPYGVHLYKIMGKD